MATMRAATDTAMLAPDLLIGFMINPRSDCAILLRSAHGPKERCNVEHEEAGPVFPSAGYHHDRYRWRLLCGSFSPEPGPRRPGAEDGRTCDHRRRHRHGGFGR